MTSAAGAAVVTGATCVAGLVPAALRAFTIAALAGIAQSRGSVQLNTRCGDHVFGLVELLLTKLLIIAFKILCA